MKEILHLCSDIYSKSNLQGLISRTEGTVQNRVLLIGSNSSDISGALSHHLAEERPFNPKHFEKHEPQILQHLLQHISLENINLAHAHSLFGSGAVAYQLFRNYNIPYIVEIRNEDVRNIGLNPFWFKRQGIEILTNASRVVFLNRNYQDYLATKLSNSTADRIFGQSLTILDGIDNFWLNNLHQPKPVSLIKIRLLYAGADLDIKHLRNLIKAMNIITKKNLNISLTIMGNALKDGQLENMEASDERISTLPYHSKEQLMEQFRNHDIFVLPETAGSSTHFYAESLTQGIPVIYNRHEGLDGIYTDGHAGYATNFNSADDIADKILLISERYATIEQHLTDLQPFNEFNWDDIYRHFLRIYDITGR